MIQSLQMPLVFFYTTLHDIVLTLPHLQELVLTFSEHLTNREDFEGVCDFISQNGYRLSSLEVSPTTHIGRLDSLSVWSLLEGCKVPESRLSRLLLARVRLDLDEMDEASRQILMRLDTLRLKAVYFSPYPFSSTGPSWMRPPQVYRRLTGCKVKTLEVNNCSSVLNVYQLMQDCQELRSLTWHSNGYPQSSELPSLMIRDLQAGLWPFLESLDLNNDYFTDVELAHLFEVVGPLKDLTLDFSAFGDLSSVALLEAGSGKHSKRMETLSLSRCSALDGVMVQRFLCEMPHLKVLRANFLTQQNIEQDPRPWVCSQLEELRIAFLLEGVSIRSVIPLTNIILDRLSGLSQLRILEFLKTSNKESMSEDCRYMALRLDYGLDRLKILSGMEELCLEQNTEQDFRVKEAQWIMDHWPRLKMIHLSSGSLHYNTKLDVMQFFRDRGVKAKWPGSYVWTFEDRLYEKK
ncbi:hypothetical protein EMPS_03841 [Entomortierella parvispora]|uniref:F-box domain-containing protein n=1 Tax=Entomortierella parvispora TaxID=205924 RepID=A0A9P3H7I5_9FUNG|nr:hypothetical protein EMPS_03841 [Entomortierella parvispora]